MNYNFFLIAFLGSVVLAGMPACQDSRSAATTQRPIEKFELKWIWEDDFSAAEQEKLKKWIRMVHAASQDVLGKNPFDLNIHFYKSSDAKEPVPWAHTRRSDVQSVHFHVNPDYSLQEFLDDWTAPHEISHVSLPFLGKGNAWFAEGFATYMQCQVMQAMGIMTETEVKQKYKDKITYNQKFYGTDTIPFIDTAVKLVKENHNYPAMYWGSVSFFILLDESLQREKGFGLNELIRKYQLDFRARDKNIGEMLVSMDSLIGKPLCKELYEFYSNEPAGKVFERLNL